MTETPTLKYDFWAMHLHNGKRLPRIVHHLSHCAVGLPAAALTALMLGLVARFHPSATDRATGVAPWLAGTLGVFCALWDKRLWIQWTGWRSTWHFSKATHWGDRDWWDFASDLGLTLLGAYLYAYLASPIGWLTATIALLALGTFNGE